MTMSELSLGESTKKSLSLLHKAFLPDHFHLLFSAIIFFFALPTSPSWRVFTKLRYHRLPLALFCFSSFTKSLCVSFSSREITFLHHVLALALFFIVKVLFFPFLNLSLIIILPCLNLFFQKMRRDCSCKLLKIGALKPAGPICLA